MEMIHRVFDFCGREIRVTKQEHKVYFIAKDVASVLEITWSGATLGGIPKQNIRMLKFNTQDRDREFTCLDRGGLLRLIMRSNKPEAMRFQDWVLDEVIPSVLDTGSYSANPNPQVSPLMEQTLANMSQIMLMFGHRQNELDQKIKPLTERVMVIDQKIEPINHRVTDIEEDRKKEIVLSRWNAQNDYARNKDVQSAYFPGINENVVGNMLRVAGAETESVKLCTDDGTYGFEALKIDGLDIHIRKVQDSIEFQKETKGNYQFTSEYLVDQEFFRVRKDTFRASKRVRLTWSKYLTKAGHKLRLIKKNRKAAKKMRPEDRRVK